MSKTFDVRMRCVVTKSVTCTADSEEQVRDSPWDYADDEREIEQIDWEIVSIKEDK